VDYGPEFFGINRSFKAIRRADVVLLVIDAVDGVTEQDQKLAGRIEDDGRACVLVVNKWDAVEKDSHTIYEYDRTLNGKLYFIDWASHIYVSALTGQRVPKILDLVDQAVAEHRRRVSTSVVNEVLRRGGELAYPTHHPSRPPGADLLRHPSHHQPPVLYPVRQRSQAVWRWLSPLYRKAVSPKPGL
jgi:predicted GTPase